MWMMHQPISGKRMPQYALSLQLKCSGSSGPTEPATLPWLTNMFTGVGIMYEAGNNLPPHPNKRKAKEKWHTLKTNEAVLQKIYERSSTSIRISPEKGSIHNPMIR